MIKVRLDHPEWLRGAFSVHPDSHMHIVCKMKNPKWLNVLLITRTKETSAPRFANNFLNNEIPFRRLQPDQWYSITVPLSKFQRLPGYTEQQLQDLLPFSCCLQLDGTRSWIGDR